MKYELTANIKTDSIDGLVDELNRVAAMIDEGVLSEKALLSNTWFDLKKVEDEETF